MRRQDLTAAHALNRDLVVVTLQKAGWDPRGWEELFASGADLTPEAQLELANEHSRLCAQYYVDEGYLGLQCVARHGPDATGVRIYADRTLPDVLATLVATQHTLTPATCADLVEAVLPLSDRVLLETGGGLVKVTDGRT